MTRVALTLPAFFGFMMLIILLVTVLFFSEPVYNVPCYYYLSGAVINGTTCTSEKVNETGEVIIISSSILFIPILLYNIYKEKKENDEERKIRGGNYY